ncbi:MAG: electron transfer flavoprotein subunit beta/FixA family protein [Desulfobacterales bacterium]|jgi:electron transfer flavoprotein beta subunit|nr:electron transfer flavoprotein subunit beta/FixA family protein [Desulfobacterales bacterium]
MNILACIKGVPEVEDAVAFNADAPDVIADASINLRLNRFDEFVAEASVVLKTRFPGTVIDIVSVGPENAKKAIQRAMGMGADAGYHILSDYSQSCDAVYVANCIGQFAGFRPYDLILAGVMSEDMMQSQTGPMVAQRLSLPWVTSVIHVDVRPDQKTVYVERELEGGIREMIDVTLPAVLTLQSGINEPRYPSISNLIRAIDAGVETITPESLGVVEKKTAMITGYSYPEKTREGLILEGTIKEKALALLKILREKGLLEKNR